VSTPNTRPAASAKQRRSQRVLLSVRLEVSGKRTNGVAFTENTSTLVVNAHGGLLLLKEAVMEGQILTLKHTRTTEETSATVMNVGPKTSGVTEVGIEFSKPNPKFWRVSFPPEDWTPHSVDAKPITFNARSLPVPKPQPAKK
jgi:hypothetical protein